MALLNEHGRRKEDLINSDPGGNLNQGTPPKQVQRNQGNQCSIFMVVYFRDLESGPYRSGRKRVFSNIQPIRE